ncbi:MAG: hypothetical protein MPW15_19545 [Candidatus Manganitrophus sp.]|nr:hypothetical protein [Candidatus Manganitrophus sp.]
MGQGVLNRLQKGFIELRLGPLHHQFHLFPVGVRQIPNDAGKLVPDISNRLHPGAGHALLKLGRDQIHPLGNPGVDRIVPLPHPLKKLISNQDQFTHEVHQFIEEPDVHPDRRVGRGKRLGRGGGFFSPLLGGGRVEPRGGGAATPRISDQEGIQLLPYRLITPIRLL